MSVKLLEFNPKEKKESDFEKFLSEDIWFSCTPDLPVLRYIPETPVFIWDDLHTADSFTRKLNINEEDFKVGHYRAITEQRWLPFINTAKADAKVKYKLPASPTWTKSIPGFDLGHVAKPIVGTVMMCSSRAVQALDSYYLNDLLTKRIRIDVKPTRGEVMKAYAYLTPTQNITKYLPHESTYELLPDIKPKACSTSFQYNSPEGVFQFMYTNQSA